MAVSRELVGVHLLVNVYDVPDSVRELLTNLRAGCTVLSTIVRQLRLNVMAETGHQFPPMNYADGGYTYAYVLSESHFTIHTYPEYHSCYIDVFCCSPSFDPAQAICAIQAAFQTTTVDYQVIRR